ncbi:hypothetical protein GGF43_002534, partial [Coemansia sp. RSA 2618]
MPATAEEVAARPIKEPVRRLNSAAADPKNQEATGGQLAAESSKGASGTAINKQVFLRKFAENALQQVKE